MKSAPSLRRFQAANTLHIWYNILPPLSGGQSKPQRTTDSRFEFNHPLQIQSPFGHKLQTNPRATKWLWGITIGLLGVNYGALLEHFVDGAFVDAIPYDPGVNGERLLLLISNSLLNKRSRITEKSANSDLYLKSTPTSSLKGASCQEKWRVVPLQNDPACIRLWRPCLTQRMGQSSRTRNIDIHIN